MRMANARTRKVAAEVHAQCIPTARHSAADCREIQKLAKRVSGRREQGSKDGSTPPPGQRPGKEKAPSSGAAAAEKELGYQSLVRELRNVFSQGDSNFGDDERRKKLYVMYGGS